MNSNLTAFLAALERDLAKASPLERLGLSPDSRPTAERVRDVAAETVAFLNEHRAEIMRDGVYPVDTFVAQVLQAEQEALDLIGQANQAGQANTPTGPESTGWVPQQPHDLNLPTLVAGAAMLLCVLVLFWHFKSPSAPAGTAAPTTAAPPASGPYADPSLGRPDPNAQLPARNTPQRTVNSTVAKALAQGTQMAAQAIEDGTEFYYAGNDPTLRLLWESRQGNIEQMNVWLARGGDPNASDTVPEKRRENALMCAVRKGSIEAVQLLLPRMTRAGKIAMNNGAATALDIALYCQNNAQTDEEGKRYREIAQLLRQAGVPETPLSGPTQ